MKNFTIDGETYKSIVAAARSAVMAKSGDSKPTLEGIFLEVDKTGIRFTALDGYKLLHWFVSNEDEKRDEWNCIMPVIYVYCRKDDMLTITYKDGRISVFNNTTTMAIEINTIKGEYINYRNIIPKFKKSTSVYLNPDYLRSSLNGLKALDEGKPVKIEIDLENSKGHSGYLSPVIVSKCNESRVKFTSIVLPIRTSENGDNKAYDIKL